MSVQRRRNHGTASTHIVSVVLLAVSLFCLVISTKTVNRLPELGSALSGSVQVVFSSIGNFFRNTIFSIRELADLHDQYDSLLKKMDEYSAMERDFTALQAENARLREQLGFAQSVTSIKTPAEIIARDPSNIYSSYTINKGISSGVVHNMSVVAFQNGTEGLVGKIFETRQNSSIVIPMYDQRFFVSARFSGTRTTGLVNGQGNEDDPLVMRYVSKMNAADVQKGDVVVTSGLDSIFPPDLAIGRVKEVVMPDYGSSAIIYLEPVINFSKLEYLFVVQKNTIESGSATSGDAGTGGAQQPAEENPR